ncbi:hypothetical protein RHGRI_020792 [Rhododendron griersonianum]|uniref:Uncharacterized protein n=1 Tax=Rhododendron griersonianum TaxID=479676 RepID=A0AAV6JNK9_9ERIC|nr:hypothetical protein RHGRI_020792 [Rhododendron griersonianum]
MRPQFFFDPSLLMDWNVVAAASGVEEPSKVTRSTHKPTTSKKGSKASSFRVDDWEEEEFDDFVSDEGEEDISQTMKKILVIE